MTRASTLARRAADRATLDRLARDRRRAIDRILREGPHGPAILALAAFLRRMSLGDGGVLVAFVEASPLRGAPDDVRRHALGMVGDAIARVRRREGLAPVDDALPGQPMTAGQRVAELLRERLEEGPVP